MNCRESEEFIAAAARDGRTLEAAAGHLAGCSACRELANDVAAVAASLAGWQVPAPRQDALDAAHTALLDRLAARPQRHRLGVRVPFPAFGRCGVLARAMEHPALLAVPGAAAAAGAIAFAPAWARVAAGCWAAVATLVCMLLLCHGSSVELEEDPK